MSSRKAPRAYLQNLREIESRNISVEEIVIFALFSYNFSPKLTGYHDVETPVRKTEICMVEVYSILNHTGQRTSLFVIHGIN